MLEFVTRSLFTFIIRSVPFKSLVYECAPIYVRLPIKRNPMTAVTTNKRPQRFFSSGSNLRFGGRQSTVTMVFHALAQSRLSPRFSSTRKNKSFLQYFATGSGTASYQDYEEYEFVEWLSEETQIIDLFTNCKKQPHKLSKCTLATRLKFLGGGGKLWLSETEVQGKFKMGGGGGGLTWNALKCAT